MYNPDVDFKGWIDNPHEVEQVLSKLEHPLFASAPGDMILDGNKNTLLYENVRAVIGQDAPQGPQGIGDCVSWGYGNFTNYTQCVQMSLKLRDAALLTATREEQNEFLKAEGIPIYEECATESVYAFSRVEVGGQRGSYSDGSVGAWAAKAMTNYGTLTRPALKRAGLDPNYDPKRAKTWGAKGVPDELEPEAKLHPFKIMSLVKSFKEAATLIQSGKPVVVCSNRGFTMTRDKQGFCAPRGTWHHCMIFVGVRFDRPGLCCSQSWGKNTPKGPLDLGQPDNTFWVDENVVDYMLRQNDSFTGSEYSQYMNQDVSIWHH